MISLAISWKPTLYEVLVYLLHIPLGQMVYFKRTQNHREWLRNVCY